MLQHEGIEDREQRCPAKSLTDNNYSTPFHFMQ